MSISTNQLDLIHLQNPWLRDNTYRPREATLPKRDAFTPLSHTISTTKQITSLIGLRRVGKSTLLKQLIASYFDQNIIPRHVLYFSFDQPLISTQPRALEQLITIYLSEILRQPLHRLNQKVYLFLDEIQLIPSWQDILKRYYDINPTLKFIVSGSASLHLAKKSSESLAGRIFDHYLPPLSFQEYQRLSGNHDIDSFFRFGQFPELLEITDTQKKLEYIKESVVEKVLGMDIANLYGIRKTLEFERLFWALLTNTGQIIESQRLMSDLAIKKATLFKYLTILENSLLITKVLNLSGSFRSEKRLLRKLYPTSTNFLSLSPDPIAVGFLAETYICSLLRSQEKAVFLHRQRGEEIDFVLPQQQLAVEVKYQNHIHPADLTLLQKFVNKKNYQGVVITKSASRYPPISGLKFIALENFLSLDQIWTSTGQRPAKLPPATPA